MTSTFEQNWNQINHEQVDREKSGALPGDLGVGIPGYLNTYGLTQTASTVLKASTNT